jgi:ubiquinone/menaquinone biosynthesis C-methylase UbiE
MSGSRTPTPDNVMQIITGGWAAAILGSAAKHGVFNALEGSGDNADGVAKKSAISVRGAQAALDGLTGLGLVRLTNGRYQNSPEASTFLVKGKPSYFGGMAEVMTKSLTEWATLPAAVKSGNPTASEQADMADVDFWHGLVPAIAALSYPVAEMIAGRLAIGNAGGVRWLDVGGGSGVWSAVWLKANQQARGVQLDWPVVNTIGREFVAGFGVADRFDTIDGDFHTVDFGSAVYDFAIYGHIAHQESPADNVAIFRKFRQALKLGGTLVINDFVLNDDRTGHPFAMMFAAQMLLVTKAGNAWRQSDYRTWLKEAGFAAVEIVPTSTPATVVLAK